MAGTIRDETGNRYGKWYVVGRAEKRGNQAFWLCSCECGNVRAVAGTSLRRNESTQCTSCSSAAIATSQLEKQIGKYVGQRYGSYTVVCEEIKKDRSGVRAVYLKTVCDCGHTKSAKAHKFLRMTTLKCRHCYKEQQNKDNYNSRAGFLYFIEVGGYVKVGTSGSITARRSQIQVNSPFAVTVIAYFKDKWHLERPLHEHLADKHIRGEWFDLGPNFARSDAEKLVALIEQGTLH